MKHDYNKQQHSFIIKSKKTSNPKVSTLTAELILSSNAFYCKQKCSSLNNQSLFSSQQLCTCKLV